MSVKPDLNQRYKNILKATIEYYIATAEPVGSKAIANKYGFDISSATIRNVMGGLEAAGLLYQPHTSAGRIPSDFGYRIYVDSLLIPDESLGKRLEKFLLQQISQQKASLEALIQKVTKMLAALSGYIAVVTLPQNANDTVRHIQLVPVSAKQIMLIVVTDSYQTESILMESSLFFAEETTNYEDTIAEELQILSNFLNQHLRGHFLAEIKALNWDKIDRELVRYTGLLKAISQELSTNFQSSSYSPLMIHGISEVLRQPEFSQLQQIQTLLYLLEEEPEQLLSVIFNLPQETSNHSKKVKIRIGSENSLEPMQTCTLISANYYADETPVGSVGVIGPTRMLYDNTIALVETTADYLSEALK